MGEVLPSGCRQAARFPGFLADEYFAYLGGKGLVEGEPTGGVGVLGEREGLPSVLKSLANGFEGGRVVRGPLV